MSTTLTLLGLSNAQAQRAMVEELLQPGVAGADVFVGAATAVDASTLQLPVSSSEGALARPDWNYRGDATVDFVKLDLTDTFTGLDLWVQLPLPTTTTAVAQRLQEIFQVRFDEQDIVEEPVDFIGFDRPITLRASSLSQRWMGVLTVRVYRGSGGGA